MAADSPITTLKNLFLRFFTRSSRAYYEAIAKERRKKSRFDRYDARYEWFLYVSNGKKTILGLAATVTSLVGVIGQTGVDAFNAWIATYAGGTDRLSDEAIKALEDWYNTYLKPLS
jgi:hypothetical protein